MVAHDDTTGNEQHSIHHHLSKLPRGFYEGYQIGKNSLGEHFPHRPRKPDSYGGETIWGQKDAIISKYNWAWEELMWGVSWANVELMMADGQRTDYERDKGKSGEGASDVLDLSDPKTMEKLTKMAR